jgi:predicted nucleic acid-binding protein
MIHLDTSFLIRALVRGSAEDHRLRAWLADGTPLGISAVSWAEFLCGPVGEDDVRLAVRIVHEPVAFGSHDPAATAKLFNMAGRRRGSFVDCMIAAVALGAGAALATGNPADFRRFEPAGLKVIAP